MVNQEADPRALAKNIFDHYMLIEQSKPIALYGGGTLTDQVVEHLRSLLGKIEVLAYEGLLLEGNLNVSHHVVDVGAISYLKNLDVPYFPRSYSPPRTKRDDVFITSSQQTT